MLLRVFEPLQSAEKFVCTHGIFLEIVFAGDTELLSGIHPPEDKTNTRGMANLKDQKDTEPRS